ncbi:hypothetical protein JXJ21_15065 [candidate division KSB1 bacterium]|nr:hypothetical protein [candidate division KSB1 bacterium]
MSIWILSVGLIVFGFLLILMEIFLVPGFNIFGVIGFILIVAGIILAYKNLPIEYAHIILVGSLIFSVIFVRILVKTNAWKRIVLETKQVREEGFESQDASERTLLGKEGVSLSVLRPSGSAMIEGKKYDVITEGGFLEKNTRLKIVQVDGNRIVVKET